MSERVERVMRGDGSASSAQADSRIARVCEAITGLLAGSLLCGIAAAQGYPAKPVRIVVPYTTGGGSDITARLVAAKLTEHAKTCSHPSLSPQAGEGISNVRDLAWTWRSLPCAGGAGEGRGGGSSVCVKVF